MSIHSMFVAQLDEARSEPVASVDATTSDAFDPSEHNVDAVLAYLDENPDEAGRVVAAETDGKARKSILVLDE